MKKNLEKNIDINKQTELDKAEIDRRIDTLLDILRSSNKERDQIQDQTQELNRDKRSFAVRWKEKMRFHPKSNWKSKIFRRKRPYIPFHLRFNKITFSNSVFIIFKQTFNTFLVTITDLKGKVLSWATSGSVGYKGKKKISHSAIEMIAKEISKKLLKLRKKFYRLRISLYLNPFIKSFIKILTSHGIIVKLIWFSHKKGHNGLRAKKKRRL